MKGREIVLVERGVVREENLRRAQLTRRDLDEALRQEGGVEDLGQVRTARLERSGHVSVIRQQPRAS